MSAALIPADPQDFWAIAQRHCPGIAAERFYEACRFGDNEAMVNELARSGAQRAQARRPACSGATRQPAGGLGVLVRWDGMPLGLIETKRRDCLRFNEVPASFAQAEGEGDGSLSSLAGASSRVNARAWGASPSRACLCSASISSGCSRSARRRPEGDR